MPPQDQQPINPVEPQPNPIATEPPQQPLAETTTQTTPNTNADPAPQQIVGQPPVQQPINPMMIKPKKRLSKKILIIIGSIIVALIAISVLLFVVVAASTKDAEKISSSAMNAIQANDSDGLYELGNDQFRKSATKEDVKTLLDRISPLLQGDEKVVGRFISKDSGQPTRAAIVYKTNTKDGDVYVRFIMEKNNNGDWQVLNFRSSETLLEAKIE